MEAPCKFRQREDNGGKRGSEHPSGNIAGSGGCEYPGRERIGITRRSNEHPGRESKAIKEWLSI
jgi:hypothetical protein